MPCNLSVRDRGIHLKIICLKIICLWHDDASGLWRQAPCAVPIKGTGHVVSIPDCKITQFPPDCQIFPLNEKNPSFYSMPRAEG